MGTSTTRGKISVLIAAADDQFAKPFKAADDQFAKPFKGGEFVEACRKGRYVAIGWNELGDLQWLLDTKKEATELKARLSRQFARIWRSSKGSRNSGVGSIYRFVREIKRGDFVLSPTATRAVLVGRVAGEYALARKRKDDCIYKQRRPVDWMQEISKDNMSDQLQRSLYPQLTVFRLSGHEEELSALMQGKKIQLPSGRRHPEKTGEDSVVGEIINFRGFVYAPINEQGVVFLFSKVSRDLNIGIEEIKTGFPDAVGRVKTTKGYARRTIEFEFKSSNYDHLPKKCDIIMCWEHDWPDCPREIEVIALKEVIKELGQ